MKTITYLLLFTALVMLSSTVAAQGRPSVSSNAAKITTLEGEVQTLQDDVANIELIPGPKGDKGDAGVPGSAGADGQDGIGAIAGTELWQMQYWDGNAWQTIAPPDMNTADAQVLTFVNGAFSWQAAGGANEPEPTIYAIGDTGPAGGIVFYVSDGGLHGLEAAPTDADLSGDTTLEWGCYGESVSGANGTAIGMGLQNT